MQDRDTSEKEEEVQTGRQSVRRGGKNRGPKSTVGPVSDPLYPFLGGRRGFLE